MSHKIKARIVGEESDLGAFSTLTLFGCELSREFTEHEVSDHVFAKLKGNRHVEVLVPRAKPEAKAPEPAKPAEPAA